MDKSTFKILIADDEPDIRTLLQRKFRNGPFVVVTCADGQEAIECLAADHYDAVITDLNMPRLNGIQLIARCRKESLNPTVHIFVISGEADEKALNKLAELGVAEVVEKPFEADLLSHHVGQVLSAQHERHQLPEKTLLDAFFQGATEVLSYYCERPFAYGEVATKTTTCVTGDVSASIPFDGGGFLGVCTLIFSEEFVQDLERHVLGRDSTEDMDVMSADVIAEMLTQMLDKTRLLLKGTHGTFTVGLPTVVSAPSHVVYQRSRVPLLSAPIESEGNVVCIYELCMTPTSTD